MTKRMCRAGTQTVLAIVAAGTGNDIARSLHLPLRNAAAAADVIADGTPRAVDAGFPKVFSGKHIGHPAVQVLQGRQVRLEAPGIVSYADGERFAPLPLTVQLVPAALNVLVPGSLT